MKRKPRAILVAGGGRGIGAAIARAFAAQGDRVFVASRRRPAIVRSPARTPTFVQTDVRRPSDLKHAVDVASHETGTLDVLVNSAGFSGWYRLGQIDEEAWTEMVDTNLKGVLFACQAAARRMRPGSSIVTVSSLAGKRGSANNALYCATKFGVNGLTQALAKELGPGGIRVNAVCPVYVETPGLAKALKGPSSPAGQGSVSEFLQAFADSQTALKRLPTAEEVAAVCLFLGSSQASAITGQCINVDCGALPQ